MLDSIIREVRNSLCFRQDCIDLVGRAYKCLCASGVVNHDMDENTISENLRRKMCRDEFSWQKRITIIREQVISCNQLLTSSESANSLPRIDFQFLQSWSTSASPFEFHIEAKNLYANNFRKSGRKSVTSASKSHERYVSTGIKNLLKGYYPENSCLLGYVLEGKVCDAVSGVNKMITSILGNDEVLTLDTPQHIGIETYISQHPNGYHIHHLMLQF